MCSPTYLVTGPRRPNFHTRQQFTSEPPVYFVSSLSYSSVNLMLVFFGNSSISTTTLKTVPIIAVLRQKTIPKALGFSVFTSAPSGFPDYPASVGLGRGELVRAVGILSRPRADWTKQAPPQLPAARVGPRWWDRLWDPALNFARNLTMKKDRNGKGTL